MKVYSYSTLQYNYPKQIIKKRSKNKIVIKFSFFIVFGSLFLQIFCQEKHILNQTIAFLTLYQIYTRKQYKSSFKSPVLCVPRYTLTKVSRCPNQFEQNKVSTSTRHFHWFLRGSLAGLVEIEVRWIRGRGGSGKNAPQK